MLARGLQLIQLKMFTSQNKQIISGGGEGESKYVSLYVNLSPRQLGYDKGNYVSARLHNYPVCSGTVSSRATPGTSASLDMVLNCQLKV